MTILLITRHPGAVEWAERQGLRFDVVIAHIDLEQIKPGDVVFGTLPVNFAAAVCTRGARFFNLSLDLPMHLRGMELSADDLARYGARLEEYRVEEIAC